MRVTIDLDSRDWLPAVRIFYLLKYFFGNAYIRRTRRGYHLKAYAPISYEESLRLRQALGDDPVRVKLDSERCRKPKQILWTMKEKHINGEWQDDVWRVVR